MSADLSSATIAELIWEVAQRRDQTSRQCVGRLRPVEGDEGRAAAPLDQHKLGPTACGGLHASRRYQGFCSRGTATLSTSGKVKVAVAMRAPIPPPSSSVLNPGIDQAPSTGASLILPPGGRPTG